LPAVYKNIKYAIRNRMLNNIDDKIPKPKEQGGCCRGSKVAKINC
jgi:hypothetical protein